MEELYEYTKDQYIGFVAELDDKDQNGTLNSEYFSKNSKKKEYFEYVDAITRVGIMNNRDKIDELNSRIQSLSNRLGIEE